MIDPKLFIQPPFRGCPGCKGANYGVLGVYGHHYIRRCRDCWCTDSYPLPEIEKTVIYLDQLVISNMMKAINPHTKAHQEGRVDKVWVEIFERLHSLVKLQVIVCPDSRMHNRESLTSPFKQALKRMYEALSHGITFTDPDTIRRFQIHDHAKWWLTGAGAEYEPEFKRIWAFSSPINVWQERFLITVEFPSRTEWIEDIRQAREKSADAIQEIFSRWQTETDNDFDYWYRKELEGFRSGMLTQYRSYFTQFAEVQLGIREPTESDLFAPVSVVMIHSLHNLFRENQIPEEDLWPKTHEYFAAEIDQPVPFSRISAMLWASIARKAASGQRRLPSRGTITDIDVISTALPYYDAMFVDKECHAFLNEEPLRSQLDYGTQVFSLNTVDKFLAFLDALRQQVPQSHMNLIHEVYGPNWEEPYTQMFRSQDEGA